MKESKKSAGNVVLSEIILCSCQSRSKEAGIFRLGAAEDGKNLVLGCAEGPLLCPKSLHR